MHESRQQANEEQPMHTHVHDEDMGAILIRSEPYKATDSSVAVECEPPACDVRHLHRFVVHGITDPSLKTSLGYLI